MAMIERIRNQQTLLLAIIGLGMLGFLIPYDAVIAMFGNTPGTQAAGSINGHDISYLEFRNEVQKRKSLGITYPTDDAARNDVWNDFVLNTLYADNYDALGLLPTQEEFNDIRYGDVNSDWATQFFYGGNVTEEQKDLWKQRFSGMPKDQYAAFAELITQRRMREKFDGLVRAGLAANSLEGKQDFLGTQEKVDFRYVLKQYTAIPDTDVEVTDADVKAYYREHKGDDRYAQKAGRNVEFIRIPLTASSDDRQRAETQFEAWKTDWQAAESDSLFLASNGLTAETSILEIVGDALDKESQAANLESAAVGDVVGPYFEGDAIRLDKVISKDAVADSTVKCRHILLKTADINDPEQRATLEARADSLKRRLKAGDSFAELVQKHSEDPGSKATDGEYEFKRGRMVKPFEDFCFDNKVGTIGTAQTTYGIHLIEVLDQQWTAEAVTVQRVEREVTISEATASAAGETAMNFAIENSNAQEFRNAADTLGYAVIEAKDVRAGAVAIPGLNNAAEVVAWAMGAEAGDISNPFRIDGNYIIACLVQIIEEGEPPFENVESAMRAGAIKEKKAQKYMALMQGNSLDEIAELAGSQVSTASSVTLKTSNISGAGGSPEPAVVGAAFTLALDAVSEPIEGVNGIWVISPVTRPEVEASGDFATEVAALNDRTYFRNLPIGSGASVRLSNAVKEKADIQDNRQGS